MKNLIATLLMAAVLVIGMTTLVGCDSTKPSPPTGTGTDKETTVTGLFQSYDKDKGELKTKVDDKDKTYKVAAVKDVKWEDFKKDDKLSITAKGEVATKVEKAK